MQLPRTDLNLGLLAEHVAARSGISPEQARKIILDTLDVIAGAVSNGRRVQITNFGVWNIKSCKARRARNPQTGEAIMIPARREPTFKFTGRLVESVYAGKPVKTIRKDQLS